jgi:hypothetical protein
MMPSSSKVVLGTEKKSTKPKRKFHTNNGIKLAEQKQKKNVFFQNGKQCQ